MTSPPPRPREGEHLGAEFVALTWEQACSERASERDDCFNLTRIDDDWHASSGNMYKKYGRDVGDGSDARRRSRRRRWAPTRELVRLVRDLEHEKQAVSADDALAAVTV